MGGARIAPMKCRHTRREPSPSITDVGSHPHHQGEGGPDWRARAETTDTREMAFSCVGLRRAVEKGVCEGFIGFLTEQADSGGIRILPGGVRGQVALTSPHLVYASSGEPIQPHERMRVKRWPVPVGWGRRREVSPIWEQQGADQCFDLGVRFGRGRR